jgi:hypothetical protein
MRCYEHEPCDSSCGIKLHGAYTYDIENLLAKCDGKI